ncbi:tetratricopeptide repeat protein [Pelagibacteraceae bacterium]|nr:tetratricopeptide repeat protein [Pelagibacteraceae bacterium]
MKKNSISTKQLITKAKKGNINSIIRLAERYYFGFKKKGEKNKLDAKNINPKNPKEAVKWFKIGALKGDVHCIDFLGYCYHMGDGVEQDNFEARKFWERSAKKGSATALCNLGILTETSPGIPNYNKKALSYFNKNIKIKKNNPLRTHSLYAIARIHTNTNGGVKKDLKKMIKYFKLAVKGGNLRAAFELVNMFSSDMNTNSIKFEKYKDIKEDPVLYYKYNLFLSKKKLFFGDLNLAEIYINKYKEGKNISDNKKKYEKYLKLAKKNMKNTAIIDQMGFPRDVTENYKKELINKKLSDYSEANE